MPNTRAKISCKVLLTTLAVMFNATSTEAQVESRWIGTNGVWSDASNWDNGVPNGDDIAIFGSGAGQITQDVLGLTLSGLDLNNESANIVLDNSLQIDQFLAWNDGKISGAFVIEFHGMGHINSGELETTFDNFGGIEFGLNGEFVQLDSEQGGAWINRSGSSIHVHNGLLIGGFTNAGPGHITIEPNSTINVSGGFQSVWNVFNDGLINIDESFGFFFADYSQTKNAQLNLSAGGIDFFQATDLSGTVSGSGSILNLNGPFDVEFSPGNRIIGLVDSAGSLAMTPSTVSNFQIGPNLTADRLSNVGGPLQLDGILNIEALPGVTTGSYSLFTYNNSFMLQVDAIELGSVPSGFQGFLIHDVANQSVNLVVEAIDPIILGDINRDGFVNLLDVNPLVAVISNGQFQVEADINGDGTVNLLDVAGFMRLLVGE